MGQFRSRPAGFASLTEHLTAGSSDGDGHWDRAEEGEGEGEEDSAGVADPVCDAARRFESLDYDRCENSLYRAKFLGIGPRQLEGVKRETLRYNYARWVMCALIAVGTGVMGFVIIISIQRITDHKFSHISNGVPICERQRNSASCYFALWLQLVAINLAFAGVAAAVTIFGAPDAAGSGIPEIKCFLNGVKQRNWMTLRTLVVKTIGIIMSVSAGLPVGKEGPMIHIGAIIGAGLPQLKSTRLGFDFKFLRFRNDRAKRDFVNVGAASGVSAAFGAPIGGVLFSLEEGASFWNQALTWRTLFAVTVTLVTLNFFKAPLVAETATGRTLPWGTSALRGGGLFAFGNFEQYNATCLAAQTSANIFTSGNFNDQRCETNIYRLEDTLVFAIIATGGGVLGALWNAIQRRITVLRRVHVTSWRRQLAEVVVVSFVLSTIFFVAGLFGGRCDDLSAGLAVTDIRTQSIRRFFCKPTEFNDLASLMFNTLGDSVKVLFHAATPLHFSTSGLFFIIMFLASVWTYGVMIPSGLFVPVLVTGAAYGRLIGDAYLRLYPGSYPGTFALIGAASFLGGVTRITISLAVILMEATNEVTLIIPLVLTLLITKWVGDAFNKGIYSIHIDLRKIPLLEWEAEDDMKRFLVKDVMATKVVPVYPVMSVQDIFTTLQSCTHNGFPVVEGAGGKFLGLILRSQLITLLHRRIWGSRVGDSTDQKRLAHRDFLSRYPERLALHKIGLPPDPLTVFMDVRPYMNPTVFTLHLETPLSRAFILYRSIGLRHIPVLDEHHCMVGMLTRRELTNQKLHELTELASSTYGYGAEPDDVVGHLSEL